VTVTNFKKIKISLNTVVSMDGSALSAVLDQVSNVTTEGRKVVRKVLPGGRSEILIILLRE